MDYQGLWTDLLDMWMRAMQAARACDSLERARPYLIFAFDCMAFEREIGNMEFWDYDLYEAMEGY